MKYIIVLIIHKYTTKHHSMSFSSLPTNMHVCTHTHKRKRKERHATAHTVSVQKGKKDDSSVQI